MPALLDEGGLIVEAADGDYEILARAAGKHLTFRQFD
jgi:hypothetical protein